MTKAEVAELKELACLRDEPEALFSDRRGRERKGLSMFLRLRPQPFGAVINTLRRGDSLLINGGPEPRRAAIDVCAQPRPDMGPIPCATDCVDDFFPAIRTGRELARYFESETPGLAHRLALSYLLRDANYSPPYQAFIWAALDVAIYSALGAAWYYKWIADSNCELREPCRPMSRYRRERTSRRPRPYEVDYEVDVLFNRAVNCTNSGDGERRLLPDPSPGTPRHPSYPSGHSTYAGAASEILSYFFPDYSGELTKLADNTGMGRLWAGIHYRSDHIEGMKLGRCVARLIIRQIEGSCIVRPDPCDSAAASVADCKKGPPSREHLCRCAQELCECCARRGARHAAAGLQEESVAPGRQTQEGEGGEEGEGGGAGSSAAVREQARGPQEGAGVAGSSGEAREQAQGPQEGAGTAGSSEGAREQAKGPQEGAQ
ncbi:MAG TPA: vanadium-dependent haloperoxidase [Thermoanaerobaculia bacterium]|nr:vanadium-dependent haloperoxidase [Thermoanaerobaculia bacterium]